MNQFGERLKKARKHAGLTQEELGERVGIQKSGVAKYENGRIVNVSVDMVFKFAHALGVPVNALVGDVEGLLLTLDFTIHKEDDCVMVFSDGKSVSYTNEQWQQIVEGGSIEPIVKDLKIGSPDTNSTETAKKKIIERLSKLSLEQLQALEKIADTVLFLRGDKT